MHLVGSHGAEFDTGFAHEIDTALLATIGDIAGGHRGRVTPV